MSNDMLGVALRDARGPLNTLMDRLAGNDGALWLRRLNQFNRSENPFEFSTSLSVTSDELVVAAPAPTAWTVDDEGNIHFTLTSNGFTCEQWEQHLERRGWQIGDRARQVLRRASEAPTSGVTYNIVVRPGKKISNSDRITMKIRAAADKKGWLKPHWEVACLIRDTFTDEQLEQMGLWYIVTMHEPIKDSVGGPNLLYSYRLDDGRWLIADNNGSDGFWNDRGGFAIAVPQE